MFTDFYYTLRDKGLNVSLNEWMTLIEALDKRLCEPGLTAFYHLCRAILVKSESDYDKLDLAFAAYFKGIETVEDIPERFWQWLDKELPALSPKTTNAQLAKQLDLDQLKKMLEERIKEQTEEHHGGNKWIGTGGTSPFGHSGFHPGGIRIGGEGRNQSAVKIAGARRYRDFRTDELIDTRSFQMAFRKLRQFSSRVEAAKTELDIDATISATCSNAGRLKLVWDRPRMNTMKVILLMDSGGSMWSYSRLCNQLFRAAHQSSHFKDFRTFYFHNCIYDWLYTDPSCNQRNHIETESVLRQYDDEYRLIIVGDASMAPSELLRPGGNIDWYLNNEQPGIWWLRRLKTHFIRSIWLNPIERDWWGSVSGAYTIAQVREVFPMHELTVEGLETGIKKLRAAR